MLSESRISHATKQFLQTLNNLSCEVVDYYFQPVVPNQVYKKRQPLTQLYTFVYENCTSKPSYEQKMFEAFKSALLKHLIKYMDYLNESLKSNRVIQCYNQIWDSYISYLKLLNTRVFSYLNRYYVPANDLESLVKVGLGVFMKTFLAEANLKVFISPYAKGLQQMRASKIINNDDLLKFSQSFVILDNTNLFRILRQIYMMEAENYYKKVFEERCNDQPMTYLNYVNNLRYFQLLLAKNSICLTESEQNSLCLLFNTQLIKRYTQIFITHPYGFSYLIRNNRTDKLKFVCTLYQKNQGFADLKRFLMDFIVQEGNVALTEKSKHSTNDEFVNAAFQFYKNYEKALSSGFSKDSEVVGTFNNAFQKVMSKFDRITEDLFKVTRSYLDLGKFQVASDKIISIFQKLPYKDEYISLYRKSLENKILSGSAIYLIEKNFIQILNSICNNQSTSELGKILEDSLESTPNIIVQQNFTAKVVYMHLWEKNFKEQLSLNLNFPEPINSKWQAYSREYIKLFPKRCLILLPIQTKLMLKVTFGKKEMAIKCNLLQACMIFYVANSSKPIYQSSLIEDLNIEKTFVHRFLEQFPSIISDSDQGRLHFNWNFETIDHLVDLDTKVEQEKKITKHIKQDRDILTQFTIVRVVKRKKKLTFQQIVDLVTHEIRLFKPHPLMIKSSIQVLKNKDVIQEDELGMICYKQ